MLVLELGGRRYPVAAGEMIVGSDRDAAFSMPGEGVELRHAVVQGWPDGSAAVRAVQGALVLVNGVRLGAEPTPLLHGDKLEIAGREILVVDPARAGSTQLLGAIQLPGEQPPARPSLLPGGSTGGRVVSLTDGREYQIGDRPLLFGRDAAADVVVSGNDVSRRHAELHRRSGGYALIDLSVNGTYVNGERITAVRALSRGDVMRMGDEEFRFHAIEPPPPGAAERLHDTMFGVPARAPAAPPPPPAASAAPLASFLVRSGPSKGERLHARVPVANVGRADYNDIVIADPSVSTMHAKLQSRGGVWVLADLGSTNGTFVDGELVTDEVALGPGALVRFGEVTALFEPMDNAAYEPSPGTRVSPGVAAAPSREPAAPGEAPAGRAPKSRPRKSRVRVTEPPPRSRAPLYILLGLLVVALGLAAFLMLQR